MTLRLAARFAKRELRGGLKGFRIFIACLALGVAAIAAVGTVRAAITAGLEAEGAALLGGDAEATFTYRFAREDELAYLNDISEAVSETVDFRSMAVVNTDGQISRALTQVRSVDDLYPLIGEVTLAPEMPLAEAFAGNAEHPGGVMERALADRLAIRAGDVFRLGAQDFILSAVLERYPDNSSGGFGFGPRTLVLTRDLADSGLIIEGTLFSTNYRLGLPPGANLDQLERQTETKFRDTGLRWRDARKGASGAERFVERIGSFLILVGLSGLAVGGVGVSAAVRAYLAGKTGVIATLKTLGATRRTIFQTYALQVGALTIVGVAIGLLLGVALPLLFAPLISAQLPIPAEFRIYPAPIAEAAFYGFLSAAIFTLWPLARTEDIRAATLFRDATAAGSRLPATRYLIITAILIGALVGGAVVLSGSAFLTLWMAGGIAGALLALTFAAFFARWLARRSATAARGRPALRLALGAIGARNGETLSVVLSLGLGLAVLASVGQIDGNLQSSFADELPEVAPSYFFLDVQSDQMAGFRERLDSDPLVSKIEAAPMLRGILSGINGRPARETAGPHWVLRGDRGVTYAASPPEGTVITDGEWWAPDYAGPPLVSFADAEAQEMNLKIGDTITVNILGRDISAKIANFRTVEFGNAGIGFVMSMNPSALAGAPHSWIATVYADPEGEAAILRDLASAYPNITGIRVRDAIDQVIELVSGIAAGIRYSALATLLTGFLVLIGAAAAGEQSRTYEAAVLKTLGASRARILGSFALRAALLGAAAGAVALIAGVIGGWAVTVFVMQSGFHVIWSNAIWIVTGGILASLLAGLGFALRSLGARSAQVLRARE